MDENEFYLVDRIGVIKDTIEKYGEENFYISFSGGKDSTVLHYLIDEALPNNKIPRVFINTSIEYTDIVKYVKKYVENDSRFIIYNSGINIPQMLKNVGYPFKSKEHSQKVAVYQHSGSEGKTVKAYLSGIRTDGSKMFSKCPKKLLYQFSEQNSLKISDQCCHKLKKETIKQWEKENNRCCSILGIRMEEGGTRKEHKGCIVYDDDKHSKIKKFKPLNPLTDEWCDWYIKTRGIKLCKLYYPPFNFKRTGCKGCPFALDLQKQLEIMDRYLPAERKQCEYLWKPVYDEYRRLGYRLSKNEQKRLF